MTTRCPLRCPFCHREGDPQRPDAPRELPADVLRAALRAAAAAGIRKFKLLGGEPLSRADLPEVVADLRRAAPDADVSMVTSGVGPLSRLRALLAAGLVRANVSIHGWSPAAFSTRGGTAAMHRLRGEVLRALLDHGAPLKLNYVWCGPEDDADLSALLDWAAPRPVVANVLDDLHDPDASAGDVRAVLERLRGRWVSDWADDDPDSLPTTHLRWHDGLVAEVKTSQLGHLAPWRACATCPVRPRCREGIYALRLTHDGRLQLCMDRPDLSLPLAPHAGRSGAKLAWQGFVLGGLA